MRIGGPLPSPPLYGREYGPLPSPPARGGSGYNWEKERPCYY